MARNITQRGGGNFPQLGGPGVQYHVADKSGAPKYTKAGNPETAWKFGDSPQFKDSANRISATANLVHSIESASPEHVEFGKLWYPKVHEAVSKGISGRGTKGFLSGQADRHLAGSALVAAVSPNMDWDRANIDAMGEMASLKSHHWDTIMAARGGSSRAARRSQAAASDVVRGMSISAAPIRNLQKAGRIVGGEDPESVIRMSSAPKTHSFMHNIADPANPHHVTVDGRAFDTLTNRMRPWETNRGIGGSTKAKSPPGRYVDAASIFQHVGGEMGLDPSATQAISWSHVKYGLEQSGVTKRGTPRTQGPARVGQPYFHPDTGEAAMHMVHLSGSQFLR